MMNDMPAIHHFDSGVPGPHILMLGGVHGTEPCGPRALMPLIADLQNGKTRIAQGRLTIIPVCNPRAAAQGVRQIAVNLNRIIHKHASPILYEEYLANMICAAIDKADVILDIHSTTAPTKPYVFLDCVNHISEEWVAALAVGYALIGWGDLYKNSNESSTGDYAAAQGKVCLTLECGQNGSAAADVVANDAVSRTLAHFDLLKPDAPYQGKPVECITLTQYYTKRMHGQFAQAWENFSPVNDGDILFTYDDGEVVRAPHTGLIFLPKQDVPVGTDWLYLARRGNA